MEFGDASGAGLLDIKQRRWNAQIIQAIDKNLMACLSGLLAPGEVLGHLQPGVAQVFGLSVDILIATGGGDNMMAAISR